MAGLRIFETDPESAPKPRQRFADDVVGRFRSGHVIGKRPMALEQWRVTTGDPEVAETIKGLYGCKTSGEWDTQGEDHIEVFTERERVRIVIAKPEHLRQEMVLRGLKGVIRRCDGVEQIGNGAGKPCACPSLMADRKAAAKDGDGCAPETSLLFRLYDNPDLGLFRFRSSSWSLVKDLAAYGTVAKLEEIDGPAEAWLGLEVVEYESGGQNRRFVKPTLDVIGASTVGVDS